MIKNEKSYEKCNWYCKSHTTFAMMIAKLIRLWRMSMKRDISDELKSILKVFAGNCVEKIEKVPF